MGGGLFERGGGGEGEVKTKELSFKVRFLMNSLYRIPKCSKKAFESLLLTMGSFGHEAHLPLKEVVSSHLILKEHFPHPGLFI